MTVIVAAEVNKLTSVDVWKNGHDPLDRYMEGWRPLVCPKSAASPRGNHLVADDRLVEDASPHLDAKRKMGSCGKETTPC